MFLTFMMITVMIIIAVFYLKPRVGSIFAETKAFIKKHSGTKTTTENIKQGGRRELSLAQAEQNAMPALKWIMENVPQDHLKKLYRKKCEILSVDEFGLEKVGSRAKWDEETDRYVSKVLIPRILEQVPNYESLLVWARMMVDRSGCYNKIDFGYGGRVSPERADLSKEIEIALCAQEVLEGQVARILREAIEDKRNEGALMPSCDAVESMDGISYEHYCSRLFESAGWQTTVTQSSSDHGCDIIATKGQVVLIVQCKRYSSPVSNKAVQEVAAALRHYGGTHCAAVSNSRFTTGAQVLARSNHVYLVHDEEIPGLYARIVKGV